MHTTEVRKKVEKIIRSIPEVAHVQSIEGYNVITSSIDSSAIAMYITLKPWEERQKRGSDVDSVIKKIMQKTASISEAKISAFNIPGIPGIGSVGGFDFRLQDYLSGSLENLQYYANKLIKEAAKEPSIAYIFTTFASNYPMYDLILNRERSTLRV